MSMDEVVARMAVAQVVGVNQICQQAIANDASVAPLVHPVQIAHAQRMANYVRGS